MKHTIVILGYGIGNPLAEEYVLEMVGKIEKLLLGIGLIPELSIDSRFSTIQVYGELPKDLHDTIEKMRGISSITREAVNKKREDAA